MVTTNITVAPVDRVLSALDALTDEQPEFEQVVNFYEEVLPMMVQARPALHSLALDRQAAGAKLMEGVPLLWGEWRANSPEPSLDLFMTLCRLASQGGNAGGETLMRALLDGKLDLAALLGQALVLDRPGLEELARSLAVDLALLEAVVRHTLTPLTWAYGVAFSAGLDFSEWQQGYCPVCGAWPTLAELRGRDRLRYLRCGRCSAGWKFNRLRCFWCDNSNRKELSFLFDPDEPGWRIDVCSHCLAYIKTAITFDALEAEMLLAHDLATLFLDQVAASQGYRRGHKQPLAQMA